MEMLNEGLQRLCGIWPVRLSGSTPNTWLEHDLPADVHSLCEKRV
jgi:hypothetical protein